MLSAELRLAPVAHPVSRTPSVGAQRPRTVQSLRFTDSGTARESDRSVEKFRMLTGDVGMLSQLETLEEPREIDFYTDSLGFRNREDYAGQPLVLLGDSFVVGNGTSHDQAIANFDDAEQALRYRGL